MASGKFEVKNERKVDLVRPQVCKVALYIPLVNPGGNMRWL